MNIVRKISAIIITTVMLLSLLVLPNSIFFVPKTAYAMTGNGSAINPFKIYNVTDLQAMSYNLTMYWELANDIDASATSGWNGGLGFLPVGNSTSPFKGNFDGKGYEIRYLFINRPTDDNIALFGQTGGATINNTSLVSCNVTGSGNVGSLVGWAENTTILNSHTYGHIYGEEDVGGLVGFLRTELGNSDSTIDTCYTLVDIHSVYDDGNGGYFGGIVGLIAMDAGYGNQTITISNSYASGDIYFENNSDDDIGGICGRAGSQDGQVGSTNIVQFDSCYSYGDIYINANNVYNVGGIVGRAWNNNENYFHMIFEDCCASTDIYIEGTNIQCAGGFVGYAYWYDGKTDSITSFERCYATGNIYGGDEDELYIAGGFAGILSGNITDCFSVGDVRSWTDPAGFAVALSNEVGIELTRCYSASRCIQYTDDPAGDYLVAEHPNGFVGDDLSTVATLTACYWDVCESGVAQSNYGTGLECMAGDGLTTMAFAGFDFSDTGIWEAETDYNYGNPYLKLGVCALESQQGTIEIPSDYEAPSQAIPGRFDVPGVGFPTHWFGCEDYDYSALPVYDSFSQVSTELGIPIENLYLLGILGIAFGIFLLIVMYVRSALIGAVGFNLVLVFGAMMCILPLWIPFSAGVVQAGILYMYKQVAY